MPKSKTTFEKRAREKQRLKNKQDKQQKKEERRAEVKKGKPLDEMLAYVDENGNIVSTPPQHYSQK